MSIDYTCTSCSNDVPFIFAEGLCTACYQAAGNTLTFPQWEALMKLQFPGQAWND